MSALLYGAQTWSVLGQTLRLVIDFLDELSQAHLRSVYHGWRAKRTLLARIHPAP